MLDFDRKFRLALFCFLSFGAVAHAQGFQIAPQPLTGSDGAILCKSCSSPPGNSKEFVAPLSALSAFIQSQMPTGGPVQATIVAGNSTGSYSVSGITAANKLLLGVAVQDTLGSTTYNYSPSPFTLVSSAINPTNGWKSGAGVITDPVAINWTGWSLIWLYQ